LNYDDQDLCEFLSLRAPTSLVTTNVKFDMKRSTLHIFQTCATASICRTIRVLRHLPGGVAIQTIEILSGALDYIDHIVTPINDSPIDGSLYNSTFILNVDKVAIAYVGSDISLDGGFREEAFEYESRVARVRILPSTSSLIHILSMNGPREALLALVNSFDIEHLIARHDNLWNELWISRIDIESKPLDAMTSDEKLKFEVDRFTIRRAMHDLHATGFMNGVDASGAAALGALPVHVSMLASLFCAGEYSDGCAYLGGQRLAPVPDVIGLKGSYLDTSWSDISRSIDPITNGMKIMPRTNNNRWAAFRTIRPIFSCLLAISLWDRYRVTKDDIWLRDIAFPIISGVAELVVSLLIGDQLSTLDGFYAPSKYANYTAANATLHAAIQSSITLGIGQNARDRWTKSMDVLSMHTDSQTVVNGSIGDTLFPLLHPSLRASSLNMMPSSSLDASILSLINPSEGVKLLPHQYSATDIEKRTQSRRRASDMIWLLWGYARISQGSSPSMINEFTNIMTSFFTEFRGPWCTLYSPETVSIKCGPDVELGASFLMALAAGLMGVHIQGLVSENSVFSTTMGVEASYSGVFPPYWQSMNLLGVGKDRKMKFLALNRLLMPPQSSLIESDIASWSVADLLFRI
jgi:hypothetical protein